MGNTDSETNILEAMNSNRIDTVNRLNQSISTTSDSVNMMGDLVSCTVRVVAEINRKDDEIKGLVTQTGRQVFGLVNKLENAMKNDREWKNRIMLNEEEFSSRLTEI
jgi:predicted GTPase